MAQEDVFKKIVSHCKEYGFVFPSSEIYDGLGAVYDYGQLGVELKNNIKQYWWQAMTLLHENIVGIDSAIFMHPTIWKASGHVDAFNDPLIDNKDSKKRYRADVLIEDQIAKYDEKIEKEVAKGRKRFKEAFDEAEFRATNGRVRELTEKRDALHERYSVAMNASGLDGLRQIILDEEIVCPISGTRNWTEVRQFNLMFKTEMGSTADGSSTIYLRPETAQGIFVNYLNVQKTGRMKIPFGTAQIGKAFRNESGSPAGKRPAWLGTRHWASAQRTIASTTTKNWHTMPMQPATSNSVCRSDSKKWRVSTPARTSTSRNTPNSAVRRSNTSIPKAAKATRLTSSRLR